METLIDKEEAIETLRQAYYSAIAMLDPSQKEDILAELPNEREYNCLELFRGILNQIAEDIMICQSIEDQETKEEIARLTELFNVVKGRYTEIVDGVKEESNFDQSSNRLNIIFAKTSSGIYFKRDLKNISNENYDRVMEMLNTLRNNEMNKSNPEEYKKLNQDRNVRSVYELKTHGIRIYFQIISHNSVFVFLAREKKSSWDSLDLKEITRRKKETQQEYESICRSFKDDDDRERIIQEHEQIFDDLIQHINDNKKGVRKDG